MHIEHDAAVGPRVRQGRQIAKEQRQPGMRTGNPNMLFTRIQSAGDGELKSFSIHRNAPSAATPAQEMVGAARPSTPIVTVDCEASANCRPSRSVACSD